MSEKNEKKEGYIHTHCVECGRSLRARAKYAGRTLRCPSCKATNVVPFVSVGDDDDEGEPKLSSPSDLDALFSKFGNGGEQPAAAAQNSGPAAAPGPAGPLVGRKTGDVPQLDTLLHSLYRVFDDAFLRAKNVLADMSLTDDKRERELLGVKRDLNKAIKQAVLKTMVEIDGKVIKLQKHPMAKSAAVRAKLEEAAAQQAGFSLFAGCVFDVQRQA